MDCPMTATYQPALACFSAPNQHRILQYLGYVRDAGLCRFGHTPLYLAHQIMPRTMRKPRSGARLSACTTA